MHALLSVEENSTIRAFLLAWKKTSSHRINRFYAQKLMNYRETCPDHCLIWQANYYDFTVESDKKLPEKIEYMHTNPVAAGWVESPLDWKWSSARFYELGEHVGVNITWVR